MSRKTTSLPKMGETAQSIRAHIQALSDALVAGDIDRHTATVLEKMARGALAATKHIDEGEKLARYEAAVAKAERLHQVGRANEVADKLHQPKNK